MSQKDIPLCPQERRGGHRRRTRPLVLEKLLVEKKDEQVDVDLGFVKHLHYCHALILQLQQVLSSVHAGTCTHTQTCINQSMFISTRGRVPMRAVPGT